LIALSDVLNTTTAPGPMYQSGPPPLKAVSVSSSQPAGTGWPGPAKRAKFWSEVESLGAPGAQLMNASGSPLVHFQPPAGSE
jgi:hypothetical protein